MQVCAVLISLCLQRLLHVKSIWSAAANISAYPAQDRKYERNLKTCFDLCVYINNWRKWGARKVKGVTLHHEPTEKFPGGAFQHLSGLHYTCSNSLISFSEAAITLVLLILFIS